MLKTSPKDIAIRNEEMYNQDLIDTLGDFELIHFKNATIDYLTWLVQNNFLDLDDQQNESPTAKQFINFINHNPSFTAHGYMIGNGRPDTRVTIEGIELKRGERIISLDRFMPALELCRHADELDWEYKDNALTRFYAWWD